MGDACSIAGWGARFSEWKGDQTVSQALYQGGVNLLSKDYCKAHASNQINKDFSSTTTYKKMFEDLLQDDELCGATPDLNDNGLLDIGVDACQGDSGGPLICDVGGFAILQGVISWGVGCNREGAAGVFADVWHFRDWIDEQIKSDTDADIPDYDDLLPVLEE